ncbi:RidA family protein [Motilimonas sp. KMU-193]|uniref:RidA family protein n=1 Tax=Motilimonas sp. KMU-193 TaxID=3388668 RepID=UPI00396AF72C
MLYQEPVAGLSVVPKGKLCQVYKVARVVKLQGFVNATADFEQPPKVLDGCSDLMADVFGAKGVHARAVFGAISVRGNLPIIIDSIFEVED